MYQNIENVFKRHIIISENIYIVIYFVTEILESPVRVALKYTNMTPSVNDCQL